MNSSESEEDELNQDNCRGIYLEYYQLPFFLLHEEYERKGFNREEPHPIRARFWQFIERREYMNWEAPPLLISYLKSLNIEIQATISKQSISYWLHLSRRISPETSGKNNYPVTRLANRCLLDIAIQKYGKMDFCDKVGYSKDVGIDKIMNGMLRIPELSIIGELIKKGKNQLVLTNFSGIDLENYYKLEKLIYEVWKTEATLRIVGKGSSIIVDDSDEVFFDNRNDELDFLVSNFDKRLVGQFLNSSKKGVVFNGQIDEANKQGFILIPTYNVNFVDLKEYLNVRLFDKQLPFPPNFIWFPFNIVGYFNSHKPLFPSFLEKYGCKFEAVIILITCLCYGVLYSWEEEEHETKIHFFQRAYEGPIKKDLIYDCIHYFKNQVCELLSLDSNSISDTDFEIAFQFLALTDKKRNNIQLHYPGPFSIFLPSSEGRIFIDYCYIRRILTDIFHGIKVNDENFKGNLLEDIIQPENQCLPTKPCKAIDGTQKQIDCAIIKNRRLIIFECKSIEMSFGVEKGQKKAISYRGKKLVDALSEIDNKARWLIKHPIGRNYDISGIDEILPVVVTPFIEYIPEINKKFWISSNIPRVLSLSEVIKYKDSDIFENASMNIFMMKD